MLCGNSEVEQQVAMLGLEPEMGRGELFGEMLPALLAESAVDACWVPSAPCGGDMPFRPGAGVANYFGVGGYLRDVSDARRAEVPFASECLAFSNVPDEEAIGERPDLGAGTAMEGGHPARCGSRLGLRGRPRPLPAERVRRGPEGAEGAAIPSATWSSRVPSRAR